MDVTWGPAAAVLDENWLGSSTVPSRALSAAVELGLRVHRLRAAAPLAGEGPPRAADAVQRPVARRPRAAHPVQPGHPGRGVLPRPGVLARRADLRADPAAGARARGAGGARGGP